MATKLDYSILPKIVTLKNTSTTEPTSFRYFRVNFQETLEPEDEVVITVTTSEELAYYMELNDPKATLEVTMADAE